jgi:hypothetical protein
MLPFPLDAGDGKIFAEGGFSVQVSVFSGGKGSWFTDYRLPITDYRLQMEDGGWDQFLVIVLVLDIANYMSNRYIFTMKIMKNTKEGKASV